MIVSRGRASAEKVSRTLMPPPQEPIDRELSAFEAAEALRWWIRSGVADALDETPHDRFGDSRASGEDERAASKAPLPTSRSSPSTVEAQPLRQEAVRTAMPLDAAESSARALAQSANDLETLRSIIANFDGCPLKRTATQLVFADGVPGSRVMLVGEAPGAEEDRLGRPFVGRAGQLLDRMLAAIGLDRTSVYIANVVPWRPPGNRTPTPQETQVCLPFIERQIELADPDALVCLGASAVRTLLGVQTGIMRARGSWVAYSMQGGREIRALAMLHPAFLLRQPAHKRLAWADLRALAAALETSSR